MGTRTTLFIVGICGTVGVLVDIDHIIAYYLIPQWSEKFLHAPLLITSSIVILGLGAYLGGLYLRMVLKKEGGERTCLET